MLFPIINNFPFSFFLYVSGESDCRIGNWLPQENRLLCNTQLLPNLPSAPQTIPGASSGVSSTAQAAKQNLQAFDKHKQWLGRKDTVAQGCSWPRSLLPAGLLGGRAT